MRRLRRVEIACLAVGLLSLGACLVIGRMTGHGMVGYLFALFFFLGLSLGSLAWLGVHFLAGGAWGAVARGALEASARMVPWLAVLFVPLLFGLSALYPWARPEEVARSELRQHRALYLNWVGFVVRSLVYLGLWSLFARVVTDLSRRLDTRPEAARRLMGWSTAWLLVYLFSVSFAAVDWVASTDPRWASSILGFLVVADQMLPAIALAIVTVALQSTQPAFERLRRLPQHLNDLGNLLLTGVMTWGYLSFVQLLIIWAGNLPHEVAWYVRRIHGGWRMVVWGFVLFQLVLPFGFLLFRIVKRHPLRLALVASVVLAAHLAYLYWQIVPTFRPTLEVRPTDLFAFVGVGGVWVAGFLYHLNGRAQPLPNDPRLQEAAHA